MSQRPHAILALADGTIFRGVSIGVEGINTGEVAFNTAMTGYQEILTDPSYCQQIITLTYPHIGNTGTNPEDFESGNINKVYAAGLVIRDLPLAASSHRKTQTLSEFLKEQNVVAIAEIDTRKLTRILREKGAQSGCIMAGDIDEDKALQTARAFPGLAGMDLAKVVSCQQSYPWTEGEWSLGSGFAVQENPQFHVAAFDFGIKRTILRKLAHRGCKVTVFPAQTPAEEILAAQPDGVFLSNGPGDPEPCDYAISATQALLEKNIPIFGICLGLQLLGLATGARTIKMKFGHHGANHPVQDIDTNRVIITSQNHGFAVDSDTLPANARITHKSLFDGSLQGFELVDKPAFCFQGHPEASPGPHEADYLFDKFIKMMQRHKNQPSQ
ncbi:MAG: glutamine-hydrolyzing carbamoyl-phosphate synthase small subunit [Nitrosomonas sp.]|uniref:glutamine-hydrolyzing carbamoyl-phosphate synthase small subunit n=1 Tax=Nitrosomonas sp. TaxID=42353 RepID=UPI002734E4FD|nr:glutamine-hydrolyzing carbamoyl-phosphate synthase small subunit [Nitrosomonas sp.]MDP3282316.1 glutamine-hydrolyzing carbamoyl-phosphate synthase small subunit [Nitrosomonas sp.]MDP3663495.1 glutamine-hydrolyzing carbamoyl-phosphate synthase small subunit [Nitrosomonas sp.]MDZ4104776.1 glutamine-hydrolyzing carbamoyl-phosphate synthase small subunit [Nitrosomonas sp.]